MCVVIGVVEKHLSVSRLLRTLAVCLIVGGGGAQLLAQEPAAPAAVPTAADKRIFGVLPNYRTVDGSLPFVPISAKRKFWIAGKDSFDYPVYFLSGAFAALNQLEDQSPEFGQGLKGYAKRYGASYADQAIGNLLTEGLYPAMLHEDTRYFRKGDGRKWGRFGYAASRVIVNRTDKGTWAFNAAEWLGSGSAVAISNLYYPPETRNVSDNTQKLLIQVATDSFSNVLKEFWPDLKRKLLSKKSAQ